MSFSIEGVLSIIKDWGLPVFAVSIAIIVFFLQRTRKSLSYRVLSKTSLLKIHADVRDKLKIIYEDKPINDLHLIILQFKNNGNEPIKSADFETNIIFEFNKEAKIISNDVIEQNPDTLTYNIMGNDNELTIYPALFNKNDFLKIKILIENFTTLEKIYGRIIGVPKITEITNNPKAVTFSRIYGLTVIGAGILFYFLMSPEINNNILIFLLSGVYIISGLIFLMFPNQIYNIVKSLLPRSYSFFDED